MVYLPGFTKFPWSSFPSHLTVYFPAERVALETEVIFALFASPAKRALLVVYHKRRSRSQRSFWNQSEIVRTGFFSLSSTHTTTYGLRVKPSSLLTSKFTTSS